MALLQVGRSRDQRRQACAEGACNGTRGSRSIVRSNEGGLAMANEGQVCASPALSGIIESHLAELVDLWKDNIRRINPGAAEGIGRRVSQEIEAGQDLLSLLGRFPTTPDHISDEQVAPLIEKVLATARSPTSIPKSMRSRWPSTPCCDEEQSSHPPTSWRCSQTFTLS